MEAIKVKKSADVVTETVKVKFNHPMRNVKITNQDYQNALNEHMVDIKAMHGRYVSLANEENMIELKLKNKFNQPYIFLKDELYEMPKEDAEYYVSKFKEHVATDRQRYFDNAADAARFMDHTYLAEIVE